MSVRVRRQGTPRYATPFHYSPRHRPAPSLPIPIPTPVQCIGPVLVSTITDEDDEWDAASLDLMQCEYPTAAESSSGEWDSLCAAADFVLEEQAELTLADRVFFATNTLELVHDFDRRRASNLFSPTSNKERYLTIDQFIESVTKYGFYTREAACIAFAIFYMLLFTRRISVERNQWTMYYIVCYQLADMMHEDASLNSKSYALLSGTSVGIYNQRQLHLLKKLEFWVRFDHEIYEQFTHYMLETDFSAMPDADSESDDGEYLAPSPSTSPMRISVGVKS